MIEPANPKITTISDWTWALARSFINPRRRASATQFFCRRLAVIEVDGITALTPFAAVAAMFLGKDSLAELCHD
jgi:hypothetical protein